jgi:hypothetical protein
LKTRENLFQDPNQDLNQEKDRDPVTKKKSATSKAATQLQSKKAFGKTKAIETIRATVTTIVTITKTLTTTVDTITKTMTDSPQTNTIIEITIETTKKSKTNQVRRYLMWHITIPMKK